VDAAQTLADLTEVSSQITAAVLATGEGKVIGSTVDNGEPFASAALELLRAADTARGEGTGELVQLEAAMPHASVFVVRDGAHFVAAVTSARPTVGLVFYDLRTCLRLLEQEEEKGKEKPKAAKATAAKRTRAKKEESPGDA
jgi:predicted regulator of Ras-like GTPase activity (Roadblock/LC7/MglB family)